MVPKEVDPKLLEANVLVPLNVAVDPKAVELATFVPNPELLTDLILPKEPWGSLAKVLLTPVEPNPDPPNPVLLALLTARPIDPKVLPPKLLLEIVLLIEEETDPSPPLATAFDPNLAPI